VLRTRRTALLAAVVSLALFAGACSSSSDTSSSSDSVAVATTAAPEPFRILVTNDDGVGAPGINAVVNGLLTIPNVEVTVVAPATNQSGSGSKTTDGPLTVTDATTESGYPAKAVTGFPADSIVWAIDQGGIDFTPDLVVSGINSGQNTGAATDLSGTVGAARAAVQRGIPALASSQGFPQEGGSYDWPVGVQEVLGWVSANRDQLQTTTVASLNIPTCNGQGTVKAVTVLPIGTELVLDAQDCLSALTAPANDVIGFQNGYVTLTAVSPTPPPTTTVPG
jgi:5'-nucleotidase